jgi:hypothetical protein
MENNIEKKFDTWCKSTDYAEADFCSFKAGYKARESDIEKINRVEVINHKSTKFEIGRVLGYRGEIEISLQDDGKTLKIFI